MRQVIQNMAVMMVAVALCSQASAQKFKVYEWGMGPEVIYNYTAADWGFGLRSHLVMGRNITISPQFAWFPRLTSYNEIYLGAGIHWNTTPDHRWGLYGLAYLGWNRWFNYNEYVSEKAKPHNLAIEPGIGVVRNKGCVRPFAEARYNWKWKEGSARIGVLLFFGYCRVRELCPPVYK